jgi:DNA-directed RNA polymerase subunit N (RpoN/RPB10)
MKIEVVKCDGCGKLIEDDKEAYQIRLEGREYYTGPGNSDYGQSVMELHFCWRCARNIKSTLEKIAANMEAKE